MNDNGPLFTPNPFSDPNTSRDSARSIAVHVERLEAAVLDALVLTRGACAFEIEARLKLAGDTVRPRLVSLAGKGLAEKTARTRLTPAGRKAAVWVAAEDKIPTGGDWP